MQIICDTGKFDVDDQIIEAVSLSIYDPEHMEYRLTVYEEDGVLRVLQSEPIVLVTAEEDLVVRHKREIRQRVDRMIECAVKKDFSQ